MAQTRRRPTAATYGSLAYDLDALARERQLEEAGRMEEREERPAPQPRRAVQAQAAPEAQPARRTSPLVLGGVTVIVAMLALLIMGYVHLTTVSGAVSDMKAELAVLNEEHVSLLTKYEQTFDLTTVKETAEALGMSKPTSAQIEYIDLSGADTAVVYRGGAGGLLSELSQQIEEGFSALVEYFR